MRPASELNDPDTLAKKILTFAQGFRSLLVPRPAVLADTVKTLAALVPLSDKVLPLKSYFNMVQMLQRTTYLARALAAELTRNMPTDTPEQIAARDARAAELEAEVREQGIPAMSQRLTQLEGDGAISEADRQEAWRRREERLTQDAQQSLSTEDVFMLACAFLELDIAKQGSIHYLKGESPDFKETKKNRNPVDLTNESVLKNLSSNLSRPIDTRGTVERSQIDSGFNHLVKLSQLHNTMLDIVQWIKEGERKVPPELRTKVIVRKHFGLSHTDYERIMSMARRENLISFRNRIKDPTNNYTLRENNHQFILDLSKRTGRTPPKALNDFIEEMRKLLEVQEAQRSKKLKSKASSGGR